MKLLLLATSMLAGLALAKPVFRRQAPPPALTDLDILQFALTLEHLEDTFYKEGFAKFPPEAFARLGVTPEQLADLVSIGETEAIHVSVLSDTITKAGGTPVQPCTYDFGFTDDPAGMVGTAKILEAVGVAAYLGAAPLVKDPAILAAAGSIVTTEARHQTLVRIVLGDKAVPQAFDVAIGARQIFTLAKPFIKECPPGSALPFEAFPDLSIVGGDQIAVGSKLKMDGVAALAAPGQELFCTFTSGEKGTLFARFEGGSCQVPPELKGEVFVTVGTSGTEVSDATVAAGPAVIVLS